MAFGFFKSILQKFAGKPIDWDDLEESLIRSDIGPKMTMTILEALRAKGGAVSAETIVEIARAEIQRIFPYETIPLRPLPNRPKVILMVGVNGTGKTTSSAKLGFALKSRGHSVMFAAADTFRAAAIEQLSIWGERLGIEVVKGQYNADPAALCYDAHKAAIRQNIEFLICDTAGRLHTRNNLMQELEKVRRTLSKQDSTAPHECFLVVDATTGGNALQQAREFHSITQLSGVVVTKLDGSGKGGVVVAIQNELGVPTRFIGTGEQVEKLAPFNAAEFVSGLL